jgi:hypothetical protein
MIVNIPAVVAELRAAFDSYERALMANDVAALDALFWDSPHTIRYGGGENLYGAAAIRAFRGARSPAGLDRELAQTVITTFGENFGTASTLYRRIEGGRTGRQMQSWVRLPEGWRVVAAHVSFLDFPFPE